MYQLNKRQTTVLLHLGKVTFLYKSPTVNILVTVYRDQINSSGIVRIPIKSKNKNFRLLVTLPCINQLKDAITN
jgi:hypothetical protein